MTPDRTPRLLRAPRLADALAAGTLLLIAFAVFFHPAQSIGLGVDSMEMVSVMEYHGMPWIALHWFGGRPFHPVAYKLAAILGAGSITGYNVFQFSCLSISALLVYALIRIVSGTASHWAYAASCLKLVWAAKWDLFDNSCLPVYFAETCFWLALVLFALLTSGRTLARTAQAGAGIVMSGCVLLAAGTYQTVWGALLLGPLAVLFVPHGFSRWWANRNALLAWYLAAGGGIAFSLYHYLRVPVHQSDVTASPLTLLARLAQGMYAALVTTYWLPFRFQAIHPVSVWTLLAAGLLFALGLLFLGVAHHSRRPVSPLPIRLLLVSVPWIVVSILPPLVVYTPAYGTRMLHFAAAGSIGLALAALSLMPALAGRLGRLTSTVALVWLFTGSLKLAIANGHLVASKSIEHQRFFYQFTNLVPAPPEGAVFLFESKPSEFPYNDFSLTWILRALTATKTTVAISDNPAISPSEVEGEISVHTAVSLREPVLKLPPQPYYLKIPVTATNAPAMLPDATLQGVRADSLVLLQWDRGSHTLSFSPRHPGLRPVEGRRSRLAEALFRGREGWAGAPRVAVE